MTKKIAFVIMTLFAAVSLSACMSTVSYKMPVPTSQAQTAPVPVVK